MTDTEIIKALECCKSMVSSCEECPMHIEGAICHEYELNKKALTLINRQKAEIERLKGWDRWIVSESHAPIIKKARAAAIKEFADKFDDVLWDMKVQYNNRGLISYGCVCEVIHEKLLKTIREMEGESNGK